LVLICFLFKFKLVKSLYSIKFFDFLRPAFEIFTFNLLFLNQKDTGIEKIRAEYFKVYLLLLIYLKFEF